MDHRRLYVYHSQNRVYHVMNLNFDSKLREEDGQHLKLYFINLYITCVHSNHVIHVSIIDHVIDNDHVIFKSRDRVGDLKCTTKRRGTQYHAVLITLIDLFRRNRHSQ